MQRINELQLAKELIRFPSVTPVDAGIMSFLEKKLKQLGFKTKVLEFRENNSKPVKNLYARLGNKSPNFCYAGHLDVVPAGNLKDSLLLYDLELSTVSLFALPILEVY